MNITALFRDLTLASSDFRGMLTRESKIVARLMPASPAMEFTNWRLKGNSLDEATLYSIWCRTVYRVIERDDGIV
ncbi:hypothetical protein [Burkholderia multivorans]|uniref:hypothetical protein n=1 Tax=Burkholderia multivorans TaxID=87883 RepID=UPI001FC843AA|nr:hypothetical protein [Burkholderia multivorans]